MLGNVQGGCVCPRAVIGDLRSNVVPPCRVCLILGSSMHRCKIKLESTIGNIEWYRGLRQARRRSSVNVEMTQEYLVVLQGDSRAGQVRGYSEVRKLSRMEHGYG